MEVQKWDAIFAPQVIIKCFRPGEHFAIRIPPDLQHSGNRGVGFQLIVDAELAEDVGAVGCDLEAGANL